MRYIPKPCDKRAHTRMWLMMAAGAVCFCLTPLFPAGRAAFQLGALLLIGGGIYTGMRYIMTEFTYEITLKNTASADDAAAVFCGGSTVDVRYLPAGMLDFVVRKKNSQRGAVMDACLDMADLRYFAPLPLEGGREREPYKKFPQLRVYYYTPSPVPQAQYMAVFVDAAHNAIGVVLEPDSDFLALFTRIAKENAADDTASLQE